MAPMRGDILGLSSCFKHEGVIRYVFDENLK